MSDRRRKIVEAIECCKEEYARCDLCPLQDEICDTMAIEMIQLPEELVEMIEEELVADDA